MKPLQHAFLAACGGGDSGGSPAPGPGPAPAAFTLELERTLVPVGQGAIASLTQDGTGQDLDAAHALALQPDERVPTTRILLAGGANGSNHDFAVSRCWP